MRPHHIVLVVAVILLASVSATVAIDSKMTGLDTHSFITAQNGGFTKRLLRIHTTAEEKDEERVITGLDKITTPLKAGASKIAESAKLKVWLTKRKSAADALAKLKLNEDVDKALASPKLNVLDRYVNMFNKKYPENQVSLLETLTAHYGDVDIAMGLVKAKQAENSKDIATKLQAQQLEGWLNSHKSVDDVFSSLNIKHDTFFSLISTKLDTLEEYIKLFNLRNPQQQTNLFSALRDGFGGEGQFAILVSTAMIIPRTSVAASKYQRILFERWIANEYDPMTVLSKVFNVDKNKLAAANARQKFVVDAYKPFYNRANGLDEMDTHVVPRRS